MGGVNQTVYVPAMQEALLLAHKAQQLEDVPVGAVVLDRALNVIGRGYNAREVAHDPLNHAEIVAMRDAAAELGSWRLDDCTLVVTLEPCTMCAGAAMQARVKRVVFGAYDAKAGAVGSLWDVVRDRRLPHRAEVVPGVLEEECRKLISDFFAYKRGR